VLVGTQLAFVAGTLALLRAVRRRGEAVIPRAEAAVLVRRAALGLAAGGATMAGLALLTAEYGHAVAGWWSTFALAAAGAGSLALGAAVPSLVRAGRVRPEAEGERGDIFDDLPQMVARWSGRSPWALALAIAGGLALVIALAGAAQSDGIDGIARGLADGLACLTGFALLGGFLGLRRATPAR
jgi:hypothetical protein